MADLDTESSAAANSQDSSNRTASGSTAVFALVQRIRCDIERAVDSVVSYAELTSPSCDYALVKPLTSLLARTRHPALLYSLLLVRSYFLERADDDLAFQNVNLTRANLCELLACKLVSLFEARSHLPIILTTRFNAFSGATRDGFERGSEPSQRELADMIQCGEEEANSALEIAVDSGAKRFIRAPAVQMFLEDLYSGELLYKPTSHHSIVTDSYKSETVERFDLATRPLLDHNVLRPPRIRRFIGFSTILILVALFFVVQQVRDIQRMELAEVLFILFTCGFALEEAASIRERGFQTYFAHLWNIFDLAYLAVFFTYLIMRGIGLRRHRPDISALAFDVLALGACVIFPRLCGMLLEDSLVLLGLRAMLNDYMAFMFLAILCSVGFLLAFWTLAEGQVSLSGIAWMLVKIFLGNSYVGFDVAHMFGPTLGPFLVLVYAVFSNTLLLTILISILTNTFSAIQYNLVEESLFQKAVTTLDMVKGDALFEFVSPTNLIALPLLLPASYLLSPRRFHQLNVLLIRIFNFPLLIAIWIFYRLKRQATQRRIKLGNRPGSDFWEGLPKGFRRSTAEKVFERKVSRAGRTVRGMDDEEGAEHASGNNNAKPLAIRGSGGTQALGLRNSSPSSTVASTAQPASLLAQLFGNQTFDGKSGKRDSKKADAKAALDMWYSAMEKQMESIEEKLDRLLSGGFALQTDEDHSS